MSELGQKLTSGCPERLVRFVPLADIRATSPPAPSHRSGTVEPTSPGVISRSTEGRAHTQNDVDVLDRPGGSHR